MAKQSNRLGVRLLGVLDGVAEGPLGIAAFVLIVCAVLVVISWR